MNLDPISRPSSTSTVNSSLYHSASFPQLPGLSTLASLAPSSNSPQLRAFNVGPGMGFSTSSPSATSGGGQSNLPPTCQNCTTSTTPLWRRDELGSVLCNACGLFLKLHGRPRPISLKTDVIKSRNRVKNAGSAQGAKKKNVFDSNGLEQPRSQAGTPPPGAMGHRRTSQKSANGHSESSNSPISRTATPSMYNNHMPTFNSGHPLDDPYGHHSPSLAPMHLRQPSPGRSASPLNGAHGLEVPQTYEQLIAQNSSLKTRVSELEVINELFRSRVTQLEQDEANARRGEHMRMESNTDLQRRLEESQRRENQLKHRLDDMEREMGDLRDGAPRAKKMRVSDMVGDSEASTPQSVT